MFRQVWGVKSAKMSNSRKKNIIKKGWGMQAAGS